MSESKHTLGKWEVMGGGSSSRTILTTDNEVKQKHVAFVYSKHPVEVMEANARLIAAAPVTKQQRDDLLEACSVAEKMIRMVSHPDIGNRNLPGWAVKVLDVLDEAIAKAGAS